MKKALMVFGFALCATFAFAQTNVVSTDRGSFKAQKPNLSELKKASVDYKASVFTKDGEMFDTVFTFADLTGITPGLIRQDDVIKFDGRDSVFHTNYNTVPTRNYTWCAWKSFSSSTDLANRSASEYPNNDQWFSNNGYFAEFFDGAFVGFVYDEAQGARSVGFVNAYCEFPTKPRTLAAGASKMIAVSFTQIYYKYYDQCFIDYKIGNDWYAREVNVMGVDCDINSWGSIHVRYVMPNNLANQTDVTVRLRVYSAHSGNSYGNMWFVGNLSILSDNRTHSYEANTSSTFDGFYGMIPQGMNIPLTYGVHVRNTNVNAINNATISIANAPVNTSGDWTNVATSTPYNIPAGNVEKDYRLYINERGFLANTSHDDDTTYSWGKYAYLENQPNYGRQQEGYTGGYQGRGFNTETLGMNFFSIKFEGDSADSQIRRTLRDSVLYTVTGNMQFDPEDPTTAGRVNGYRWARENGIIGNGTSFHNAFTDDGYLTDADQDGHANQRGYQVMTRFITGDQIPEGYVFKGIEYIPSTSIDPDLMKESAIYPLIFESNGGTDWTELSVGIDNMAFEVTDKDVSNLPSSFALPSPNESNYSALNIEFGDEPVIKKNTAYYFGYVLAGNYTFELAAQSNRYKYGDSTYYYSGNAQTRPYYRQNYPISPLDLLVYDRTGYTNPNDASDVRHWIYGWSCEAFPMIRPIIGPAKARVPVIVTSPCDVRADAEHSGDSIGYVVEHNNTAICGEDEDCAAGTRQIFDVVPFGKLSHSVITNVYVNGVELTPVDEEYTPTEQDTVLLYEGPYNVIDTFDASGENVILYRNYYRVVFFNIPERNGGYVITADYEWQSWDVSGIDPVSPDVRFSVSPNPATSVVKLNVAGVSGMVNCSILDMSGRVIYNREINAEVENTINVSNFPAGAYFVRITNNTFSKIEKLIVK